MPPRLRIPGQTTRISDGWAAHRARGSLGGIDFVDGYGTPIYAQADGVVTIVDNSPDGSGGRYVRVTFADGSSTECLHASQWICSRGQVVRRNQLIGYSGASAFGSNYGTGGPHIHNHAITPSGVRIDPTPYIDWDGSTPAGIGSNYTPIPGDETVLLNIGDEDMRLLWDVIGGKPTNGYLQTAMGTTVLSQQEYNLFFRAITSDQKRTPFRATTATWTPVGIDGYPHLFTPGEMAIMDAAIERCQDDFLTKLAKKLGK
jgi:hypothetical protein